jgi:hypothetical protein
MKYRFEIENGQITDGYTVIQIINHEAEIGDEAEILLAEKHGGELAAQIGEATGKKRRGIEAKLGETAILTDEGDTN